MRAETSNICCNICYNICCNICWKESLSVFFQHMLQHMLQHVLQHMLKEYLSVFFQHMLQHMLKLELQKVLTYFTIYFAREITKNWFNICYNMCLKNKEREFFHHMKEEWRRIIQYRKLFWIYTERITRKQHFNIIIWQCTLSVYLKSCATRYHLEW